MKKFNMVLLVAAVAIISVASLRFVSADRAYIRDNATLKYNYSKMLALAVDTRYFVSTTPYTISNSNGIYMQNTTKYRNNNGNFVEYKHWDLLMKETNHRNWNDQDMPSGYSSTVIRSINVNATRDSSIYAKFGINDPWDA